jgi:hypothetical protein
LPEKRRYAVMKVYHGTISLTDKETGLFEKSWTEIYEMMKKESDM